MRPVPPRVPLAEVVREWGRIGVVGFGGPPAHVALLRDLVVERLAGDELPDHGAPATHDRCPAHCCPAPQRPRVASAG